MRSPYWAGNDYRCDGCIHREIVGKGPAFTPYFCHDSVRWVCKLGSHRNPPMGTIRDQLIALLKGYDPTAQAEEAYPECGYADEILALIRPQIEAEAKQRYDVGDYPDQIAEARQQGRQEIVKSMISRATVGLEALPMSAAPYWVGYWTGLKDYGQAQLQKWNIKPEAKE